MLAILLALGSGPASLLGARFGAAARLALTPVLGLCAGTCVFTTLIGLTAADNTYWLVPVLALASLALAARRTLAADRSPTSFAARAFAPLKRLGAFDALALLLVCVVVAAPLDYTLHERHSVGPTGLQIWDADGYTADADAMLKMSLPQAGEPQSPSESFARLMWASYSLGDQNLDVGPLSANVNGFLGLGATSTQGLYLVVFLMMGGLGAFGAVRYLAPRPRWVAALAGLLFAGPFFLQLLADGSEAATSGLGLILPLAVVGFDALRHARVASLAVLALLAAGLMALYPLFVPGMAFAAAAVLLAWTARSWRTKRPSLRSVGLACLRIAGVVAAAIAFDVVGFARDARYWRGVLEGGYYLSTLPVYHLPYSVLPGWLLQTREFYFLTELGSATFKQVLLGVILPGVVIAVMVAGAKRLRSALVLAPAALIFAAMAWYVSSSHGCSYCTDRTLLPIAPLSIGMLAIGIAALAMAPSRWTRALGIVVAIGVLVTIGQRTRQERLRFSDDGYFLDAGDAAMLSHLPAHAGPVDLEGFGEIPNGAPPGELPLVYMLTAERNDEEVSLPTEYDEYNALAYFGGLNAADPHFHPQYKYVLTRVGGVQTGRRVIARTGPLALEERTSALDASVVAGITTPFLRFNASGLPWVSGPLHMILAGASAAPAWIEVHFRTLVPVTVPAQATVTASVTPGEVTACVLARGQSPLRRATIELSAPQLPGVIPHEPYAEAEPAQGIQLVGLQATSHCSLKAPSSSAPAHSARRPT